MKICRYDSYQAGAVVGDRVYPIGDTLVEGAHLKRDYTMVDFIDKMGTASSVGEAVKDCMKSDRYLPLTKVKLRAPIDNPSAIWAAAENYASHVSEMRARAGSQEPIKFDKEALMLAFFLKPPSSIIGPGETIILPKGSKWVDFECELCAVIGETARHITEERALDYVFGYTICWDISQREPTGGKQTRCVRKGYDTFAPLGPWIVTRDEIEDPQNLGIKVEQNGALVMEANTKEMICTLREQIRYLSNVATLRPGDLITTGTPAGVHRIEPGDRLQGAIEGIGEMTLSVKGEN